MIITEISTHILNKEILPYCSGVRYFVNNGINKNGKAFDARSLSR